MAARNLHVSQPLEKQGIRNDASCSRVPSQPAWKKYFQLGKIAENNGKTETAAELRKKAFDTALKEREYVAAEVCANLYLSKKEMEIASSLAVLRETASSGRRNPDLRTLALLALDSGAPRSLVELELSCPPGSYHNYFPFR